MDTSEAQTELVGQVAYAMSKVLEMGIYQGEDTGSFVPLSLKELQHEAQTFEGQKKRRWEALLKITASVMPVEDMVKADSYLRWLTTEREDSDATLPDLLQWAQKHCDPKAVHAVQNYIRAVALFSDNDDPLKPSAGRIADLLS